MKSLTLLLAAGMIAAACPMTLSAAEKAKAAHFYFNADRQNLSINNEVTDAELGPICANHATATDLDLDLPKGLHSIEGLSGLKNLQRLAIRWQWFDDKNPPALDLTPLSGLTKLEIIRLFKTRVKNTAALAKLDGLKEVSLSLGDETDASFVLGKSKLKELGLTGAKPLKDYTPIGANNSIRQLYLSMEKGVKEGPTDKNLEPLSGLENLHTFGTTNCPKITTLNFLKGSKKLSTLRIQNATLKDISVVSTLRELEWVEFGECRVTDLTPLRSCKKLKRVTLPKDTDKADIDALQSVCPKAKIEVSRW